MTNNFLKLDYHKGQEPNTLRILSEAMKRTSDFFVFSFKKKFCFPAARQLFKFNHKRNVKLYITWVTAVWNTFKLGNYMTLGKPYNTNEIGPRTEPWGTPHDKVVQRVGTEKLLSDG